MNRCIIIGAMSHASGGENTKLLTMTTGIQRNACCDSAGVVKTVTRPPLTPDVGFRALSGYSIDAEMLPSASKQLICVK